MLGGLRRSVDRGNLGRIYDATEWEVIQDLVASLDTNGDNLLCSKQLKPNQVATRNWWVQKTVPSLTTSSPLFNKVQGR